MKLHTQRSLHRHRSPSIVEVAGKVIRFLRLACFWLPCTGKFLCMFGFKTRNVDGSKPGAQPGAPTVPQLLRTLDDHRVSFQAPTGSGKSTVLPLIVTNLKRGVVLGQLRRGCKQIGRRLQRGCAWAAEAWMPKTHAPRLHIMRESGSQLAMEMNDQGEWVKPKNKTLHILLCTWNQ